MPNPTKFTWVDPTQNTDGSPIASNEITGYNIGVRDTSAPGSTPGSYPINLGVSGPTAVEAALMSLAPGSYAAAIQSIGPVNSAFSAEVDFAIAAPTPNPPSGFSVS